MESSLARERRYRSLLADVYLAQGKLSLSSEGLTKLLLQTDAPQENEETRLQTNRASRAYQDARKEFMLAAGKLLDFLASEFLASEKSRAR